MRLWFLENTIETSKEYWKNDRFFLFFATDFDADNYQPPDNTL